MTTALDRILDEASVHDSLYYNSDSGDRCEVNVIVSTDDRLYHFPCKSRDMKTPTRAGIDAIEDIYRDINHDSGIKGGIEQSNRLAENIIYGGTDRLVGDSDQVDVTGIDSYDDLYTAVVFGAHYEQVATARYEAFLEGVEPTYVTDIYSLESISRIQNIDEETFLSYIRFRNWLFEVGFELNNVDELDIVYAFINSQIGKPQVFIYQQIQLSEDLYETNLFNIAKKLTQSTTQAEIRLETIGVDKNKSKIPIRLGMSENSDHVDQFLIINTEGIAGNELRFETINTYLDENKNPTPPIDFG